MSSSSSEVRRAPDGAEWLWETDDYFLASNTEAIGYQVINRNTGQVELVIDQEPQALIGMQYLQEAYNDIMADPVGAFKKRKANEMAGRRIAVPQSQLN